MKIEGVNELQNFIKEDIIKEGKKEFTKGFYSGMEKTTEELNKHSPADDWELKVTPAENKAEIESKTPYAMPTAYGMKPHNMPAKYALRASAKYLNLPLNDPQTRDMAIRLQERVRQKGIAPDDLTDVILEKSLLPEIERAIDKL